MTRYASDGLAVSADPAYDGVRAIGSAVDAVFPGQHDEESFLSTYDDARGRVMALLHPRWSAYHGGDRVPERALDDVVQQIVIHWFSFYNMNYGRLKIRTGPLFSDLTHPPTYRIIQGVAGNGGVGAALAGLGLADWQRWAEGDDQDADR